MRTQRQNAGTPATLLFWTLTDEVIERPDVLERQFHEIRESGFGGVAAFVRCTRYNWHDRKARQALARIGRLCKQHRMQSWIGPDPRFVSRELIPLTGGLEVLLFGDRARAEVFPNVSTVTDGRFSIRCDIGPRHVHTLQEVAIQYIPRRIEKLYAYRMKNGNQVPDEIRDVTGYANLFYNARDHYIEAFGQLPVQFHQGEWRVLAFFRASTNHVDFSDRDQMKRYLGLLDDLKKDRCHADGLMWDEPGFTCTYGTLPYSPNIRKSYVRSSRKSLDKDLWKLAFEAGDGSHVRVRAGYYAAIQRLLNDANALFTRHIMRHWGGGVVSGIHDTWHFESADMCDMNHGSLDLWRAAKSKTGGFVDLGGIDKLREPDSPWNSNLAAMSVICASLGKVSSGGYAYNNLWTVGDDGGEGWQATVMDHCVNSMALFGTRWLAHCYGPVGTIGEEQSFLGSPPMPGYPNHSTWRHYPAWNRRLNAHLQTVEHALPVSNVLVLFPIEALYGLAGQAADRGGAMVFDLILSLIDKQYHVDVLSASACAGSRWVGEEFLAGKGRYRAVIAPFAVEKKSKAISGSGRKPLFILDPAAEGAEKESGGSSIDAALAWLEGIPGIRPVTAPDRCWVTMTPVHHGTIVTISPSRHGYRYCGEVNFNGQAVELPEERSALSRILFKPTGEAYLLPNSADFSLQDD